MHRPRTPRQLRVAHALHPPGPVTVTLVRNARRSWEALYLNGLHIQEGTFIPHWQILLHLRDRPLGVHTVRVVHDSYLDDRDRYPDFLPLIPVDAYAQHFRPAGASPTGLNDHLFIPALKLERVDWSAATAPRPLG